MVVTFYSDASGARPVAEYMRSLDSQERARLAEAFFRIQTYGLTGSGVSLRQIEGKLWEVRVSAQRAFYVVLTGGDELVVLHAYKKEGQKAPKGEIKIAKDRMKDVLGE